MGNGRNLVVADHAAVSSVAPHDDVDVLLEVDQRAEAEADALTRVSAEGRPRNGQRVVGAHESVRQDRVVTTVNGGRSRVRVALGGDQLRHALDLHGGKLESGVLGAVGALRADTEHVHVARLEGAGTKRRHLKTHQRTGQRVALASGDVADDATQDLVVTLGTAKGGDVTTGDPRVAGKVVKGGPTSGDRHATRAVAHGGHRRVGASRHVSILAKLLASTTIVHCFFLRLAIGKG